MAVFNAAKREIDIKIVYYGPALCGKTSNVQCVHKMLSPTQRGDIMSLATKDDRTLFFDFLPIELGDVKGFKTRFHVYTVPGQVYYALTRRAVLTGVDGVVFVADSQASKMEENIESLHDLNENLNYYKKDLSSIPFVMQYNKRDLDNILPVDELNQKLNPDNVPSFAASAVDGTGVIETLTACCKLVLKQMDSAGGSKKRRRQRMDDADPTATSTSPLSMPADVPAAAAPPSYQAEQKTPSKTNTDLSNIPSLSFDDDDGPVVKIISNDAFLKPSRPFTPQPDTESSSFDRAMESHKEGLRGSSSFDDLAGLPPTSTAQPSDASPGSVQPDDEDVPSLDMFESVASSLSRSSGSDSKKNDFTLPSFDDDPPQAPIRGPLSESSFDRSLKPVPSAGPVPASSSHPSGFFEVVECGTPEKISHRAVKLPVTLRHSENAQVCSITVTISFDDSSCR